MDANTRSDHAMPKEPNATASNVPLKLKAKAVFLAGNFYHHKETVEGLIKLEGGKIADELTDKVDIMVRGYSGHANPQKKATKLIAGGAALQVLAIDQFQQHIKPTPDEAVHLLRSGAKGIERWNRHCGDDSHYYGAIARSRQAGKAAYLRGADFARIDLSGANLGELVDHCDFTGANLSGCHLYLSNCQLGGAMVDGVVSLVLTACTAEKVDFSRIAARGVHIETSNLTGSRFAGLGQGPLNFGSCQLDGADFSGLQASPSLQFRNCSLVNANFAGANLEQADFMKSDLSGADFTNANLKLAKLNGAKVDGANFSGATMVGADVANVDFSKAKGYDPAQVQANGGAGAAVKEFLQVALKAQRVTTTIAVTEGKRDAILSLVVYPSTGYCNDTLGYHDYAYIGGGAVPGKTPTSMWTTLATKWHGATADPASVTVKSTKAPLANKELKQLALRAWCELFGIEPLSDEDLKKAAGTAKERKKEVAEESLGLLRSGKAGIEQWNANDKALAQTVAKLSGVDLSKCKLAGVRIRNVEWTNANLSGADLSNVDLMHSRFPDGNFSGAKFKGAELTRSTFREANLEGADLSKAKLFGISLKRANCKDARFAKADLRLADLCGADLTGADLDGALVEQSTYDENTRWPKGFTPTLEMIWKGPGTSPAAHKLVQATKPKGKLDIEQFMKRLEELTDASKLAKALAMLKADRFRLYAQVTDDHFVGVVKSQSSADLVYSCRLNGDGTYACCTQNLNICGGLRGSLCKHLLVLIVGLAKAGDLDPNVIDTWIRLSKTNKPALDKDAMSETFLRYKGAEAGEVDWRPTETIPEDYYAM
jgi:uncharacterized protein YjbI with pentapeptide repeats